MRILIADDDELFRAICGAGLSGRGHEVRATDGPGALGELARVDWDALVVDVLMPEVDGMEVILAALATPRPPRIVAVSGGGKIAAADCLSMAAAFGAEACLNKPIDMERLACLIEAP